MKFLITGGAGFIGSAVIRHILEHSSDAVVNVDCLTYAGNPDNLHNVSQTERYRFEPVNICDRAALQRVFAEHQPDAVMHLAAESHVDRSIDTPATFIETNIVGTYTLLEVCRHYWQALDADRKQAFRFHHVSTDEVYGDLPHPDDTYDVLNTAKDQAHDPVGRDLARQSHPDDAYDVLNTAKDQAHGPVGRASARQSDLPLFTEETAYAPSSPYSASKAGSDHLVRAWQRTYGLPTLVSNCSNNYGPYQFPEKLIPLMILNALAGKPLTVYGAGDQIRDWLYVDDHARALYAVITQGQIGETYNIGGHNEKKNIEVIQTLCDILETLAPIKNSALNLPGYQSLITFVKDRPGHDRRYAIDAGKIEKELGWTPRESFESGLLKTVRWYLEHPHWCQRVLSGAYRTGLPGGRA